MSEEKKNTPFSVVYQAFFSKITDDMYMQLTPQQTYGLLRELLLSAIHKFEFPRQDLGFMELEQDEITDDEVIVEDEEDINKWVFVSELTNEEINILATYMVVEWLSQQLASVENVRMKYSGSDFKFTSQANHMQKILQLKKDYEREGFHLQRLYKRRKKDENGIYKSTMGKLAENHPEGGASTWHLWY